VRRHSDKTEWMAATVIAITSVMIVTFVFFTAVKT